MHDMNGKLWIQTRIATTFQYDVCAYLHSILENYRPYMDIVNFEQLLYYRIWHYSELELDVKYNWWVMAPNTNHSVFSISQMYILKHIGLKLHCIYGHSAYWMNALLLETFCEWVRVAWEIWLESYCPRNASGILWCSIMCVYCKPIHTLLFAV